MFSLFTPYLNEYLFKDLPQLLLQLLSTSRWGRGKGRGSTRQQWNLEVTRGQGTGKICCYNEVSLYRGSFSYILLLLRQRKSFVIPRTLLNATLFPWRTLDRTCVAGAGLFFRAKEEISRTREGRKEEEEPAAETLVFHLRPQFNNVTALHQQTSRLTI